MEYTNRELIKEGCKRLAAAGIKEADNDAWLLFSAAAKMNRTDYLMRSGDKVSPETADIYFEKINRRSKREPVQYIEGIAPFMGYEFAVNENVLIPRMDTEILVSEALKLAKLRFVDRIHGTEFSILDMCTGSGCIAQSMYLLLKKDGCEASVTAVDISNEALEVAKLNAKRLDAKINFIKGNLFENVSESFSMILSNPPYIRTDVIADLEPEVREHEPVLALDGTKDGLYFYRKITDEAWEHLESNGLLMYEIGYDQALEVSDMLNQKGYQDIRVIKDFAGLDRVVVAVKPDLCNNYRR